MYVGSLSFFGFNAELFQHYLECLLSFLCYLRMGADAWFSQCRRFLWYLYF